MEFRCHRCNKIMSSKKYMIQPIVYLGDIGPRYNVCENCYQGFMNWMASGDLEND